MKARAGRARRPAPAGAVAAAAAVVLAVAAAAASLPASAARAEPLCIDTRDGRTHRYRVEVAATPRERERGLMFRTELAPRSGMLLVWEEDTVAHIWMKNTYVPLDIVFVDGRGEVRRIAPGARPLSLDTISSGSRVRAALELAAGEAARTGLAPGDRVRHPLFGARCGD